MEHYPTAYRAATAESRMRDDVPRLGYLGSFESQVLPLFAPIRPMARSRDPKTSKAAAMGLVEQVPKLQRQVLDAYHQHGPMGARAAERLPEFASYGPSTIRKRISELAQRGLLFNTGLVDRNCIVYSATSSSGTSPRAA